MDRRQFFKFFRAAPVALPVMVAKGFSQDGLSIDGTELRLNGRKVMVAKDDGSIVLGSKENIILDGPEATIYLKGTNEYENTHE